MAEDLIAVGVELMLVGMSTVFSFLALLVLATTGMSRLAARFDLVPEPLPVAMVRARGDGLPDERTLAIMAAAVHAHRNRTGDQP